jgi:hypothetical protein
MNATEIRFQLMTGTYTNEDLTLITDALRYARSQLAHQVKRSIRVGDNVNFVDNRNGTNYTGAVTKIAIKYVHVATSKGTYRVPANMLTVI